MKRPLPKRDSLPSTLDFWQVDQHHVLATFRNVGIAVWVDETQVEAVHEAQRMLVRLAAGWPEGIAFLQVIGEEHPNVDPPARAALKELLYAGRSFLREAPVVYEGSGFRAASVRAVVTGLLLHRGLGFPQRVYSSVEDAALAVARPFEKREPTRYARELCEALTRVRERHERAFPSAPHSFIRYNG